MKLRIAIWASAGFLVAAFWALFAIATFPSTSERMRDVWILISLTCPVSIAGMHYQISLYEVLAANAVTYALVGLIVETLRHQLQHAK
jgi:Ca2+/Na+ antiporter